MGYCERSVESDVECIAVFVVLYTIYNVAVICGCLDWSYDCSGVLKGYALEDKSGNGIIYSVHVYPWKSDWQGKFLDVAAKHPLFLGEVGCQPKPMPFEQSTQDPYVWGPKILACIQKNRLNWSLIQLLK